VRKVEKERSIDQCSKTLSLVMMVQGLPKTEASAKDVPLDAALAESLLKLKLSSPYNNVKDWCSLHRDGKGSSRTGRMLYGSGTVETL
jgi:hypothetical protein